MPRRLLTTCLTSEMARLNSLTRISTCSYTSELCSEPRKDHRCISTGHCKVTRVATSPTAISDLLTKVQLFRRHAQVQVHSKIMNFYPST